MKGPSPQKFRLRSMYAERESDCLVFQEKEQSQGGGLELVETPFAVEHTDKVQRVQRCRHDGEKSHIGLSLLFRFCFL